MKKKNLPAASLLGWFIALALVMLVRQDSVFSQDPVRRIDPEFEVKLFDETVVDAGEIQNKITVIDFWATWCKPCLAEIPGYNAFYREYKGKGVSFLALAIDSGDREKVLETAKRLNMEYPAAAPTKKEIKAIGKIRAFPTTWVVGPDGEILKEFVGVIPGKLEAIRDIVDNLLAGKSR